MGHYSFIWNLSVVNILFVSQLPGVFFSRADDIFSGKWFFGLCKFRLLIKGPEDIKGLRWPRSIGSAYHLWWVLITRRGWIPIRCRLSDRNLCLENPAAANSESYVRIGLKFQPSAQKINIDNKTPFGYSDKYCLCYWVFQYVGLSLKYIHN